MRFRFSILSMLVWTTLLGLTLAVCLVIPSLRHLGYRLGSMPEAPHSPGPDLDEVMVRFAVLVAFEVAIYGLAKILARAISALGRTFKYPEQMLPDDVRKI